MFIVTGALINSSMSYDIRDWFTDRFPKGVSASQVYATLLAEEREDWLAEFLVLDGGLARALVACGADVNAKDDENYTPLRLAGLRNRKEVAEVLIEEGARPDVLAAAGLGLADELREMLNRDSSLMYVRDSFGRTLLHWAAMNGHEEAVTALIDLGVNVNVRANDGSPPLHEVAIRSNESMIRLLLSKGADVNARSRDGQSALHSASWISIRDGSIVRRLIASGAEVDARDHDGCTPLHSAAHLGSVEAGKALIEAGADVNARDAIGRTPLEEVTDWDYRRPGDRKAEKSLNDFAALMREHGGMM